MVGRAFFSGNWWFGRFQKDAKFGWGTFSWPGSERTLGASGEVWVVPKNARNKKLAYDFIDIAQLTHIGSDLVVSVASDACPPHGPGADARVSAMTECVTLLEGTLTVTCSSAVGTTVRAVLPAPAWAA
ncbi:hypothetical protein SHL15_7817 [Streptomyces hygroscopicus subsp. limoneus]|nr:hypothetical protein SHL15_7817 [Streptomyces hygroscopicus subsp. limoneus]